MRTTVLLQDNIYAYLVQTAGKRGISTTINKMLFEHCFKERHSSMFGADPWLKKAGWKDLRDHHEHGP